MRPRLFLLKLLLEEMNIGPGQSQSSEGHAVIRAKRGFLEAEPLWSLVHLASPRGALCVSRGETKMCRETPLSCQEPTACRGSQARSQSLPKAVWSPVREMAEQGYREDAEE